MRCTIWLVGVNPCRPNFDVSRYICAKKDIFTKGYLFHKVETHLGSSFSLKNSVVECCEVKFGHTEFESFVIERLVSCHGVQCDQMSVYTW